MSTDDDITPDAIALLLAIADNDIDALADITDDNDIDPHSRAGSIIACLGAWLIAELKRTNGHQWRERLTRNQEFYAIPAAQRPAQPGE
jgi:hypothetical protein